MNMGYKVRLYPTTEQQVQIAKTTGCARLIYNRFLDIRQMVYEQEKRTVGYNECSKLLTVLKQEKDFAWLKQVDKCALQNSLRDLNDAFVNFFSGKSGYPRYKSKHKSERKYRTNVTNNNTEVNESGNRLKLPKLGWVKCSALRKRPIEGRIINVTVSQTPDGLYFASICCEVEQPPKETLQPKHNAVGIDLGLKQFGVLSSGDAIENPTFFASSQRKLATLQRRLSKKQDGSKNREKARKKLAKQHRKVANQRRDFLHKQSTKLINENQVICIEDLHVRGMVKNHRLAKAISDAGWGMFRQMVIYKATWHKRQVLIVDRFYPSTKICNTCGNKNPMLTLSDREWVCPVCRQTCDRDQNAAKNILREGLRMLG